MSPSFVAVVATQRCWTTFLSILAQLINYRLLVMVFFAESLICNWRLMSNISKKCSKMRPHCYKLCGKCAKKWRQRNGSRHDYISQNYYKPLAFIRLCLHSKTTRQQVGRISQQVVDLVTWLFHLDRVGVCSLPDRSVVEVCERSARRSWNYRKFFSDKNSDY